MFAVLHVILFATITPFKSEKHLKVDPLATVTIGRDQPDTRIQLSTSECNFENPPQCMEVTLQPYQYANISTGQIQVGVGYQIEMTFNYSSRPNNNGTLTFCYPLSPQLHQCLRTCHNKTSYAILNHTLYSIGSNEEQDKFLADLGDYYIDDDENAITCTQVISSGKRTRCNYVDLQIDDCVIFSNGTLYSQILKTAIHRATYLIHENGQNLRLCYPLDISVLNCMPCRREKLPSQFFELLHDYRIYIPWWDISINVGKYYYENENDSDPYFCRGKRMSKVPQWTFDVLAFPILKLFYALSAFFLLAAVLVETILPTLTSYDKSLLCHNISITIFYIYMAICRYEDVCYFENPAICCTFFTIAYLAAMSTCCWLNVCAFDVWRSFKHLEMSLATNIPCQNKKFRSYSQFAWGAPILLCTLALIVNFSPAIQGALSLNFSINCINWFEDPLSRALFYTIPMVISVIVNIVLFCLTIYYIKSAINDTQIVCRQRKTKLLLISIKLFIASGIGWIIEGFIWLLEEYCQSPMKPYWYIPDFYISTQGIAVSLIVLSRKITDKYWNRYITLKRHQLRQKIALLFRK